MDVNYVVSDHLSLLSTLPDYSSLVNFNLDYVYEVDYDSFDLLNHVFHNQKRHVSYTRSFFCLSDVNLFTKQVYDNFFLFFVNFSKKV